MMKYISIFRLVFRCLLVARKGEFDRFFNRLDRPVEESRPDRPVDPTGAGPPDRFPSLVCAIRKSASSTPHLHHKPH